MFLLLITLHFVRDEDRCNKHTSQREVSNSDDVFAGVEVLTENQKACFCLAPTGAQDCPPRLGLEYRGVGLAGLMWWGRSSPQWRWDWGILLNMLQSMAHHDALFSWCWRGKKSSFCM